MNANLRTLLLFAALAGCDRAGNALPAGTDRATSHTTVSAFRPLYSFKGTPDGAAPSGSLVAFGGDLYGTTAQGGSTTGDGTIYKITLAGSESVVYRFDGKTGATPVGLTATSSMLYGATYAGGNTNLGTVFKFGGRGSVAVLHDFAGGSDGQNPAASVISSNGMLYGTTEAGGYYDDTGTVFSIDSTGATKILYHFTTEKDGIEPTCVLVELNKMLFGTTYSGDLRYDGIVFAVPIAGGETIIHRFQGGPGDGMFPAAGLATVDGIFYGTTTTGGANDLGTVYRVRPPHAEQVIYSFKGGKDGATPYAPLIYVDGAYYGTTAFGGNGFGTIFKVTAAGTETVLYRFTGRDDGAEPLSGLTNVNGTLYGTAYAGGKYGNGSVFSYALGGAS